MFGTPGSSYELDAVAFGLSTLPVIATMLLVVCDRLEERRRRSAQNHHRAIGQWRRVAEQHPQA